MRKPDLQRNMLRVLHKEIPDRATLFELFLNPVFYRRLAGRAASGNTMLAQLHLRIDAFAAAGYDYATTHASDFHFTQNAKSAEKTISLNDNAIIVDWQSFEAYKWNDPKDFDTSHVEKAAQCLPEGMKLMVMGPGGVLENVIALVGYDRLCILLYDEPELVRAVADHVGSRLVEYYRGIAGMDTVGFLCSNDDWGFNTQTFLSPQAMREYIFPWHKRIVQVAHDSGKPCILHSCGYFGGVIDDVIGDMGYDARHSYEDNILPVEQAYEQLQGRIAVLGGIDMHFMVTQSPEAIFQRAEKLLMQTKARGGYCLGTGNSVPEYIPFENYMAMLRAAWTFDE